MLLQHAIDPVWLISWYSCFSKIGWTSASWSSVVLSSSIKASICTSNVLIVSISTLILSHVPAQVYTTSIIIIAFMNYHEALLSIVETVIRLIRQYRYWHTWWIHWICCSCRSHLRTSRIVSFVRATAVDTLLFLHASVFVSLYMIDTQSSSTAKV
jgi:hypothetical protein